MATSEAGTMNTKHQIQLDIPVAWQFVSQVRSQVEELVKQVAPELCQIAALVASELVENAIKYGEPVALAPQARFCFTISHGVIVIEVQNGVHRADQAQTVIDRIRQITESTDREMLYLERMQDLVVNPEQQGQLGLYRISYEGQFELSCTYQDELLTVRATRDLK